MRTGRLSRACRDTGCADGVKHEPRCHPSSYEKPALRRKTCVVIRRIFTFQFRFMLPIAFGEIPFFSTELGSICKRLARGGARHHLRIDLGQGA